MKRIEARLADGIGLDVAALGRPSLERAVRARMAIAGTRTMEDYLQLLDTSACHWEELIESVIVPETWFFREPETFDGLKRFVLEHWLARRPEHKLKLLSLPCSSGEEPYSLAMTLLDAGLTPESFTIDAIDISSRALARAHGGLYGKNAFRTRDLGFRSRYFRKAKDGFHLHPSVRACVRFQQGNLISESFIEHLATGSAPGWYAHQEGRAGKCRAGGIDPASEIRHHRYILGGPYDCIFCRNLLIYFDEASQRKALAQLRRLLHKDGVLFLGPAEKSLALQHGFVRADLPMALRHEPNPEIDGHLPPRNCSDPATVSPVVDIAKQLRTQEKVPPPPVGFGHHTTASVQRDGDGQSFVLNQFISAPMEAPDSMESPELLRARCLADRGQLDEAARVCQNFLETHPDSAGAYYLLGLIRDTAGLPGAADLYRKALYLEPGHQDAIRQMAFSAEREGDDEVAARLRRRLRRCGSIKNS